MMRTAVVIARPKRKADLSKTTLAVVAYGARLSLLDSLGEVALIS